MKDDKMVKRGLVGYMSAIWCMHMRLPIIVINTNLPHILHRFRDIADYWSIFCYQ